MVTGAIESGVCFVAWSVPNTADYIECWEATEPACEFLCGFLSRIKSV